MTCVDSVASPPTPASRDLFEGLSVHAADHRGMRRGRADLASMRNNQQGRKRQRQAGRGGPWLGKASSFQPWTEDPEACLSVPPSWVLTPHLSGLGSPHLLPVVS